MSPSDLDPAVVAFLAYLLIVVVIGAWSARRASRGLSEYFLAGRRLGRFVVALSAVVSGRSAWLLLGLTGMAWVRGASAVWAVVGYITVELLLFLFYADRLRRFSERYDCLTVPDFFAARFGDRTGVLRYVLVGVILVFMVAYVSAQFVAGGKAFAATFEIDATAGVLLTAAIVAAYTLLGGFLAVSLTDTVQAVFMIVALVVVPVLAIADKGGLAVVLEQITALDPTLVDPWALSTGALMGFVGIGLGSPGSPHILVRYMSIANPRDLKASAVIGTVWNVVMAWGALFIGLVGRAWFPSADLLPGSDPEALYPTLAEMQLPPLLFGLVIASIFAAIMSTADSQLLVAASSVVRDLYEKIWRRKTRLGPERLVFLSRVVILALVAAATVLGLYASELVFWLVLFAWAGLGAALGPPFILALYWRRSTRAGIMSGLVTGTAITFVWKLTPVLSSLMYELLPAFAASLLVTVGVSLVTSPPEDTDGMFATMSGSDLQAEDRTT